MQVRGALKRLESTASDVVLVGHEIRTGATHEALRIGRGAKATTVLNPAPASGLPAATLALADIITPNRGELEALAGPGVPAARARELVRRKDREEASRSALVSLGSAGALLVTGGKATTIKAPPAVAVDTVGAGDTLNGALAAGLAAGLDSRRPRGAPWPPRRSPSLAPAHVPDSPTAAELEAALAGSRSG